MEISLPALSAQIYTVREFIQSPADFATSLKKIRSIGYRAIEISGLENIPTPEVKNILDDSELIVSGSHYDFEPLQTRLDDILEQCFSWNCKNLLLTMMPESYANQGATGYEFFIQEVNLLSERVHQAGFTLSYHNHNYEFTRFNGRTGLDWIFQGSASSMLGMQIDTYWIQMGGGDPVKWIRKVAGRISSIHLKDFAVDMWTPIFAEVGQGNLNWPEIIQACRDAGVEWHVVEQDECWTDPYECLQRSYDFLTTFNLS
jgi:sugar phosphate isomerase/epimerase